MLWVDFDKCDCKLRKWNTHNCWAFELNWLLVRIIYCCDDTANYELDRIPFCKFFFLTKTRKVLRDWIALVAAGLDWVCHVLAHESRSVSLATFCSTVCSVVTNDDDPVMVVWTAWVTASLQIAKACRLGSVGGHDWAMHAYWMYTKKKNKYFTPIFFPAIRSWNEEKRRLTWTTANTKRAKMIIFAIFFYKFNSFLRRYNWN